MSVSAMRAGHAQSIIADTIGREALQALALAAFLLKATPRPARGAVSTSLRDQRGGRAFALGAKGGGGRGDS
eukprot:4364113-Pleurochrysis_carterae.AAC.2